MVKIVNKMNAVIPAISVNEGLSRVMVASFCSLADPTFEELADIKCAVSEAITNAIVHAYALEGGLIYISLILYSDCKVKITIKDKGCGIDDVKKAREPLFTTDTSGERSGMGFSVMESFTDRLYVSSKIGKGTKITMVKHFGRHDR